MQRPILSSLFLLTLAAINPSQSTPLLQSDLDFLRTYNRTQTHPADAQITSAPFMRSDPVFMPRGECNANPCGWNSWLCCGPYATCYTDAATQAQCASIGVAAGAPQQTQGGYWQYSTITYCVTATQYTTATFSTYIVPATPTTTEECGCEESHTPTPTVVYAPPPSTQTADAAVCTNPGQTSCGPICCASGQTCVVEGQCAAVGAINTYTSASGTYSPPLRATTSTMYTVTVSPTTTVAFEPAVATGSNATLIVSTAASTGLSGGAIAGIVVGILIAIIILMLLCLFLCFRGLWHTIFGGGGNRNGRRKRTVVEEEYRGHGSRSERRRYENANRQSGRNNGGGGGGGGLGWASAGAALAGLGALLGMRKSKNDQNRRRRDEKSEYSASSGYYESEESYESSDRRTRDTRRSHRR